MLERCLGGAVGGDLVDLESSSTVCHDIHEGSTSGSSGGFDIALLLLSFF